MELSDSQAQKMMQAVEKLKMAQCLPEIPPHPKNADIDANMKTADEMWPHPGRFYNQVKNKAPWDYKQQGSQYQEFGNFNYGATGAAFGFPESRLLREAGRAQQAAGTSKPEWGSPGLQMSPLDIGKAPYGDDPKDQEWIKNGINFAHLKKNGAHFCK